MRLKDKVALVTGGSRSIGRAIALGFAREGADVAVNYQSSAEAAVKVVEEIQGMGRKAIAVQADVSAATQVRCMVDQVIKDFGHIDILVNNAGILSRVSFFEITEEEWDRVLGVTMKGPFLVGQAVARHMVQQGSGTIINISSISAHVAADEITHYQVAKAGVAMLTRGMAFELAKHGIRVNAIEPGLFLTDMNRERLTNPQISAPRFARILLGRPGQPEELVGAAVYLASAESSFTTGTAIRVDGGQTIW